MDPADERLSYMALSLLVRAVAETRRVLFVPVGAGSSAPPFDKWAKLCAMLRLAFLPFPNSTWFTVEANLREHIDSSALSKSGAMLTTINVLPSPPKHGASKYVSLLLRYGMCLSPRPTAAKTSPRHDKLLLMAQASVMR